MTTVAYKHADCTIAVDSRITAGHKIVCDDLDKSWVTDEYVFFMAGALADIEILAEHYPAFIEGLVPQVEAFIFHRREGVLKHVHWSEDGEHVTTVTYDSVLGSGSDHALTAMDLGASADEAVAIAATRDAGTGGTIRVHDLTDYLIFDE